MDDEIVEFLRSSIRSVWNVELLLVLAADPTRTWTADELVLELRASDYIVQEGLRSLAAAGLVGATSPTTHGFMPASEELRRIVGEVERQYRERPQMVTRAIFSAPNETLRTFADAFRIKRD
jgi:hypothetical protein